MPGEILNLGLVQPRILHDHRRPVLTSVRHAELSHLYTSPLSVTPHIGYFKTFIHCGRTCPIPVHLYLNTYLASFYIGETDNIRQCFQCHSHFCCLVTIFYPTVCNPMDSSLPGPSVRGISQARRLEWAASSLPEDLPDPGIEPGSPG